MATARMTITHGGSNLPRNWMKLLTASAFINDLSTVGQRRDVYVDDDERLYRAFYPLIEFEDEPEDGMILLSAEGRHRTAFIRKSALDYVSIPTQKYEAGSVEAAASEMEEME
jgi:hypothetical protein